MMNRNHSLCGIFLLAISTCTTFGATVFYGGDFDGRANISSEQNTFSPINTMAYDDVTVSSSTAVSGLWGNFLISGSYLPNTAYFEIRSGMAPGNGGTLVQSGTFSLTAAATGRTLSTMSEYQLSGATGFSLNAGTYWLGIAPIGNGTGQFFATTTSGTDLGPGGDPNPSPTGGPLANGNSLLFTEVGPMTYDYIGMESLLGAGTYDLSYGITMESVPEPSGAVLALVTIGAFCVRRGRHAGSKSPRRF